MSFQQPKKNLLKKMCWLLAVILLLTACGGGFQPEKFLKASLDKSYLGKVKAYTKQANVDQTLATALHKLDIETGAARFLEMFGVAEVSGDTMENVLIPFVEALYAKSKYAVGEAVQRKEGVWEIPVRIQPMGIYQEALKDLKACTDTLRERNANGEFSEMDEAAYGDECVKSLLAVLEPYLENMTYLEEQTVQVHVLRNESGGYEIPAEDSAAVDNFIVYRPF